MPRLTLIAICATLSTAAAAGPDAMTSEEARHLISRTGFGAAPHEIADMTGKSYADAVAEVITGLQQTPTNPMPAWTTTWAYPFDQIWTLDQTTTELFYTNRYLEIEQLAAWWIAEMVATPSPLTERLTLFWSDHFANGFEDHENPQWMAAQNAFLRANAAGNFATLADGMLRDPAMLIYLDNVSNIADAPNENLGREFLELFTLGEGRGYSQDDVRGAAQILTGFTIEDAGTPFTYLNEEEHRQGPKTIFGKTADYDVNDLTPLTLSRPEFGPYIVEKLWHTFVSDQPDPAEVARLTGIWKAHNLELEPLLEALFLTEAFWNPANRGRLVKSPLEMLVGTSRSLGLALPDARELRWMAEELGQTPFMPPNVGGWPEGTEWINDATASGRATVLTYLLSGADGAEPRDSAMMMTAAQTSAALSAGPNDLRVGQVFSTYVEPRDPGHGYGAYFTLFDVGFAGTNHRSISFWLEHNDAETFTSIYPFTGDCTPACLQSLPDNGDNDGVVAFEPWDGFLDENGGISEADRALLRAISTHLPALVASVGDQVLFQPNPVDPNHVAQDVGPLVYAAEIFAENSAALIGEHDGALVFGFSQPAALGLDGNVPGNIPESLDDYIAASEASRIIPVTPQVTYASARDWLNALPGTGPESARAAKALLSVPRAAQGMREEMIARDAEALLRSIILSPVYQVK